MRYTMIPLTCIVASSVFGEVKSVAFEETIAQSIEAYQPAWKPPERELGGLVVVIDPARSGDPGSRRIDEMVLMAGEHLYHLVRQAGGVPVLTHSDDQPVPESAQGLEAAIARQIVCSRGNVLLRIQCPAHPRLGASDAAAGLDRAWVDSLSTAAGSAAEALAGFKAPACAVTFAPPTATDAVADRLTHRTWAEQLYRGIAAFSESQREALRRLRAEARSGALPSECRPVPLYPTQTPEQKRQAFARQLWPEGDLPAERAEWFCQMYARLRPSNRTIIYFDPHVQREGDRTLLVGGTTDRRLSEGILAALRVVGVEAEDRMRLLPDERALGQRLFGACRATMARTFAQPTETSTPQTQTLYGEPLFLLDRREGHYLAQAGDGYWGWMREETVEPMTREQFAAYTAGDFGVLLEDTTHKGLILRRGTRLPIAEDGGSAATYRLRLPESGTLAVAPSADDGRLRRIENGQATRERVLGALQMLYTPYVFGARSPIGLDCSGMTAYLSEMTNLAIARDAAQQALAGRLVATRWHRDGIRTGDFLYFIDESGKIFHTGIALSATHFVHTSPPETQISSLRPGDRLYSKHWDETFFIAKRP